MSLTRTVTLVEDLELPLDEAGFSTRACPRCRAAFGIRWNRRDASVLASALACRLEHLNAAEAARATPPRHCPYCAAVDAAEAFWVDDDRAWFEARVRDLLDELRWRRMRTPSSEDLQPRGVTVAPGQRARLPSCEDEDALFSIPLPCCGEEMKVSEAWTGPVRCHFCGFVHARSAVRDIGLEFAQLRDWIAEP